MQRQVAMKVSSKAFEDAVQEKIEQEVERHLSGFGIQLSCWLIGLRLGEDRDGAHEEEVGGGISAAA